MQTLPRTHSCFVCGAANPAGLALTLQTDGERVEVRFRFGTGHAGFKGAVHGGLIMTILDEAMVWACGVRTGRFAYSAEMTTRFLAPAKPGEQLTATGELTANRRHRLFETRGELRRGDGVVLATATGKYLPIPPGALPKVRSDFVDPALLDAILRPTT